MSVPIALRRILVRISFAADGRKPKMVRRLFGC